MRDTFAGNLVNQVAPLFAGVSGLNFALGNVLLSQLDLPLPSEPMLVLAAATFFEKPITAITLIAGTGDSKAAIRCGFVCGRAALRKQDSTATVQNVPDT